MHLLKSQSLFQMLSSQFTLQVPPTLINKLTFPSSEVQCILSRTWESEDRCIHAISEKYGPHIERKVYECAISAVPRRSAPFESFTKGLLRIRLLPTPKVQQQYFRCQETFYCCQIRSQKENGGKISCKHC